MKSNKYVKYFQLFSTGVSIFLNTILILLIFTKSSKHLGSYKYLMIYISIYEFSYSIIDALLSPTIFSHGSLFLVIVPTTDNFLINNKQFMLHLDSIWCGFFGAFMGVFALQFIYRYYVVSNSIKIKSFNDYRIIFWMSIPIVTGIFWGIMTETLIGPTVQIDNAIENILLSDFDTHIEDVTYIGPYLYQKQVDGSIQVDIKSFVCLIVMVAIILLSMGLIVVSAFKCFLGLNVYLEVNRNVSKKYNSLQVQLFNALIIQTLIPILLMHLPCLTIFVCAIFEIDLGHSSVVMTITTALFPALDPLPVMLIIKDYRNALTNIVITRVVPVKKKKKKSRNENATNNF